MAEGTRETSIREKLRRAFIKIALIASISGMLSIVAMKAIDVNYGNLVEEKGFSQGMWEGCWQRLSELMEMCVTQ